MSSLSASQADGYYVPPIYYDSGRYKKESRNKFEGSQKGHNQYVQNGVVRFELPYHGTCTGCGAPVGKGTRFNATKRQAGSYFTSPVWEFIMKCRKCAKIKFRIRTNPKEQSFDYVSGIHKKTTEFDTVDAGTAGVIETDINGSHKIVASCEATAAAVTDSSSNNNAAISPSAPSALTRLETIASGKRKAMTEYDELQALQQLNSQVFQNDASTNANIRKEFRIDRIRKKKRLESGKAFGWKEGMQLKDSILEDTVSARKTIFRDCKITEQAKFRIARTSSIFSASTSQKKKKKQRRGWERTSSLTAGARTAGPDVCTSSSKCMQSVQIKSPAQSMQGKPNVLVIKGGAAAVDLKISLKKNLDSTGSKDRTLLKSETDTTPIQQRSLSFDALVNYESSSESD